ARRQLPLRCAHRRDRLLLDQMSPDPRPAAPNRTRGAGSKGPAPFFVAPARPPMLRSRRREIAAPGRHIDGAPAPENTMPTARLRLILLMLPALALAGPAAAGDIRYFSYDPADAATERMTRGITLEVEQGMLGGLLGGMQVHGLYSTAARGSARLDHDGGSTVRGALPEG